MAGDHCAVTVLIAKVLDRGVGGWEAGTPLWEMLRTVLGRYESSR